MAGKETYERVTGSGFRAPGATVQVLPDPQSGPDSYRLHLRMDGLPGFPQIRVRIVAVSRATEVLASRSAQTLIHFPGGAHHPAGAEAGVSWFNDHGEGWLRLIRDQAVIVLPLMGWNQPPEAQVVPHRGKRGPARSMDLWLAVQALLRPLGTEPKQLGIVAAQLRDDTGINAYNVYDWINRATQAGMLTQLTGWSGRGDRYLVPPAQIPVLGEFVRNGWLAWRRGEIPGRVAPMSRFFVATAGWPTLAALAGDDVVPTGITWLEGHGGGRAVLSPEGTIPQLAFLCRAPAWDRLVAAAGIAPRAKRERPYDSEAIILAEDHPLWAIRRRRQDDEYGPGWEGGLRALDAMLDPAPRVRDAAKAAWQDWLEQCRRRVESMGGGR